MQEDFPFSSTTCEESDSEAVGIAFSIRAVGFVPNGMGELQAKDRTLRRDRVMSNSDHLTALKARAWKTGASSSVEIRN